MEPLGPLRAGLAPVPCAWSLGPGGPAARASRSRCGGALECGPQGNGVTAGRLRQHLVMFEAKYFRGDTAGGFASTKKDVFSWHSRAVVIVSEDGGTSRAGPSPQAALGGTGREKP